MLIWHILNKKLLSWPWQPLPPTGWGLLFYISNTSDEEDQVVPLLHKQDQPKERDLGEEGQGRVFGGYCLLDPLPC